MNDREHDRTEHEPTEDVAFARLQAADPAAGSEPNLPALYAAVAEGTGIAVTAPQDELAARRNRRAPRWITIAAAVAGVAVIGGGSYAFGLNNAPPAVTAEPAISLGQAPGAEVARDEAATSMAAGGPESAKLMYPWYGGRTVFTASGLSTDGGSGGAWGFDAAGTYSEATVTAAAAALGVDGQPRQEYGNWSVGPTDGSGPSVSLSADGLSSLSYYDPTRDPWNCQLSPDGAVQPDSGTTEGGVALPEPAIDGGETKCPAPLDAPTGDAAVQQATDVLVALGIDVADYQLTASTEASGPQVTYVTASQTLDGQLTGVTASVTVVADGVQSVYAPLAPMVELGTYDVVSPTEAVERLGDPRFGVSGGGGVIPLAAESARVADDSVSSPVQSEPTVPETPSAGSPLAWPVQEVTLVSARLGVALTTLPTGASVLVPTYELADADGVTWSVIAVVDDQLDFSAAG
ncbi:hypothetical protein HP550_16290 [Cellulomonas humilata]|uniref:Uncharacterized protein n=1 Tax=Cellulomonas humilata TaxID=144055 RepID=A0A7Y6A4C0_9CELL|nr:hypothetical protein [Cellulomonas humilata]NUU18813.1 hypothetical protein [Cellulomonas humilata]